MKKSSRSSGNQQVNVFREMFKTHNAIMLQIAPDSGKIIDANTSASVFYGYSIEELCNLTIDDINTMSPEEILNERQRAMEMKNNYFIFQHKLKNNEIRTVEVHSSPIYLGDEVHLFSIIHDISDRAKSEEDLYKKEKLLRAIAENYPNSYMSIINKDFAVEFSSGQEFKKQNLDPDSFTGLTVEKIFGDEAGIVREYYEKTFGGEEQSFELFVNNQHQLYKTVPLSSEGGEINRILSVVENITDRKKFETELKHSEARFRALLEVAPVGIAVHCDMKLIYVNPEGVRLLDAGSEENLIGKSIKDIIHTDDLGNALDNLKKLKNGELGPDPRDYTIVRFDGSLMESQIISTPLVFEGKDAFMVIVTDISKRKQSEFELRSSEEKLRNILENSTNLFYSHTSEHFLTYLSPQVEQILGYTMEEALVKWTEFASDHPVNEIGLKHTMKAIETGERQPPYELELVRKDGEKIWVEVREFPQVVNGKTVSISGSLTEITERKKAIEALKKSEEQFRLIAEYTGDNIGITTFDRKAEYVYVSPSIKSVLGYQPADLLGKSFFDFIHPDDKGFLLNLLKKYMEMWVKKLFTGKETEIRENIEYRFRNKAGEWRMLQSTVTIMGKQLLSVTRDITEQKRNQEEIIRLKEGLEEEVEKKTAELKEKVSDLQRFFDAAVDRELRMKELYEENEKLRTDMKKGV